MNVHELRLDEGRIQFEGYFLAIRALASQIGIVLSLPIVHRVILVIKAVFLVLFLALPLHDFVSVKIDPDVKVFRVSFSAIQLILDVSIQRIVESELSSGR